MPAFFQRLGLLLMIDCAAGAKKQASALNLGDATLLVLDGLVDDGMQIARVELAKDADVNIEIEADDGSKGTPLAVAIHTMATSKEDHAVGLLRLLLAHTKADVNKPLTSPVGSTMPPLLLAMTVVSAGVPAGLEIAKLLLAREDIQVNAASASVSGPSTLAPLHMALAAAARGMEAGFELTEALLSRSEIDVEVKMVGPDGEPMTPLMKLTAMLQERPDDENLKRLQTMLEASAATRKKDEL
jgi:hypothetical protein